VPNPDNYLREDELEAFLQEISNVLVGEKLAVLFAQDENADNDFLQTLLREGLQELAQELALSRMSRLREIIVFIEDWYKPEVLKSSLTDKKRG